MGRSLRPSGLLHHREKPPNKNKPSTRQAHAPTSGAAKILVGGFLLFLACAGDPADLPDKTPVYFTRGDLCFYLAGAQCRFDDRCGIGNETCLELYMLACCDDTSQRRPNHRCDHPITTTAIEIQRCVNEAELVSCLCQPDIDECKAICLDIDLRICR